MRILTVRQPWAWAIIHGGKDVENRVRNIAGDYRGPVAIHAALARATAGDAQVVAHRVLTKRRASLVDWSTGQAHGVILGVVDLIGAHRAFGDNPGGRNLCGYNGQCSDWAEPRNWHLELTRPRALAEPIPYRGALGLRHLDDDTTAHILAQIGEPQ
ncbi:hypothetical protein [Microbacterium testaceum]|uniref:hypothetical protein n=1 Tax=Microbacterium testaceum TaxID=2033 RepID=UPI002434B35E|nr:hypothetical protein [Microbacterium testaceum]